jgi:type IV secretory pathway ATPase VirB11/archaellum biosynthesis ATPase
MGLIMNIMSLLWKVKRFYELIKFNYYTELGVSFRNFQTREQLNLIRVQLCNDIVRVALSRDELISERNPILQSAIDDLNREYINLMTGLDILNKAMNIQLY